MLTGNPLKTQLSTNHELALLANKHFYQQQSFINYSHNNADTLKAQFELLEKGSLFLVVDIDGIILYANEKYCESSNYKLEELVGHSQNITIYPDFTERSSAIWHTIMSGQMWQGEVMNKTKDGKPFWVYATIYPLVEKYGKPTKFLSSSRDITKEKTIEEKYNRLKLVANADLFESVNYAKQVHRKFLTPDKDMAEIFPESFLIYKAQNIVSGDFYMCQKEKNQSSFILGDSTGHGVSASYISIMILNILKRILRSENQSTCKLLEELHEEICVIRNSNQTESFIESADMAFCKVDREEMKLEYNLAKLRGVLIREGEVIELKRDKFSIGELHTKEITLSSNIVDIRKNDIVYLYTDGFIDQFGGMCNKKFGNKQLLEKIKDSYHLSMKEQKSYLLKVLNDWQGNYEQTDDISLIGIQI